MSSRETSSVKAQPRPTAGAVRYSLGLCIGFLWQQQTALPNWGMFQGLLLKGSPIIFMPRDDAETLYFL